MSEYRELIGQLARAADLPPPSFANWNVGSVCKMVPCQEVASFFADAIPTETLDFGLLRLLSPSDLSQENEELIPGCHSAPHGLITIATTDCGDSVSLDLSTGETFLIGVDMFEADMISPGWKPDYSGFFENIPITRENMISTSQTRWPDIKTALVSLLTEED